ncbi:prohead protease [Clostridium pasteurianum]|nr:prohead protease [Clostridium pasteurianum]
MIDNIKEFVRNILSDINIINLTGDKTVHFLHAAKPTVPYIEYQIFDEKGNAWEEGKEISTDYYLQVDIFSKGNYTNLENVIKEKMKNAGFERGMAGDLYEKDTQLYHKAMRFIFTT